MEYTNKTRTVNSYLRDIKNKNISFKHKVQRRGNQWNKIQKSKLIYSLVTGYMPIPPIHVLDKDNILWVIDGKQRLTTINSFVNDEFKLDKSMPAIMIGEETVELAKKKYSDLPEELQVKIKETEILQVKYKDYTDEQISEIYAALNNGTPLSADQKLRAALSSDVLEACDEVAESEFFTNVANITKGQFVKGEDLSVILQAAMLCSDFDFKDFSGKELLRYASSCDTKTIGKLKAACDNLCELSDEKKKYLKKISLPMIIAGMAIAENKASYLAKVRNFINTYESNKEYRKYCMTSTAKKENVLGRWEFFKG